MPQPCKPNLSTPTSSQVRKVDPVPASSLNAAQQQTTLSTPITSQVRKVDPVPAPSLNATQQSHFSNLLFSKLYHPSSFIAFDNFSESSGHHQSWSTVNGSSPIE